MSEAFITRPRTFFGVNPCTIDAQRRVLMPKAWRLDSDSSLTQFYIVPAFPNVIKILDQIHFDKFRSILENLDDTDPDVLEGISLLGSLTSAFTPDRQGRFTIPQEIIDFGNLGNKVVMVGAINFGRIISAQLWDECGHNLAKLQKLEQNVSEEHKKFNMLNKIQLQ